MRTDLRGDLVLIKVGQVLEFGENVFGSGKGLWLAPLPLLSLLPSWADKEDGEREKEREIKIERGVINNQNSHHLPTNESTGREIMRVNGPLVVFL